MNSKNRLILVIDDCPEIRELVRLIYNKQGYEVEMAADGLEAIRKLKESNSLPSLILLDLMMPVMDGFQFYSQQQSDPRLKSVPVLLMSADVDVDRKASEMGVRGYLKKPVRLDVLLKAAEKFCDSVAS